MPVAEGEETPCTAMESDWGDEQPNFLMHPPCQCARCTPPTIDHDSAGWLRTSDGNQPLRVEPANLGMAGRESLG